MERDYHIRFVMAIITVRRPRDIVCDLKMQFTQRKIEKSLHLLNGAGAIELCVRFGAFLGCRALRNVRRIVSH